MRKLEIFRNYARFYLRMFGAMYGIYHPVDFVEFLSCQDREIRWDAADFLSSWGDKSISEPVFRILQREPDMMVAKKLVWTLERGEAWDNIFLLLDSPKESIRGYAASSLSLSGQRRFVIPLLERMKECDGKDRNYWLALRGIVDGSSVQPILDLLSQVSSPAIRGDLLYLLGYTKDPRVFDFLVTALDNQDEDIRAGVVSGIVAFGGRDSRTKSVLQKLLADPSETIRSRARIALEHREQQ